MAHAKVATFFADWFRYKNPYFASKESGKAYHPMTMEVALIANHKRTSPMIVVDTRPIKMKTSRGMPGETQTSSLFFRQFPRFLTRSSLSAFADEKKSEPSRKSMIASREFFHWVEIHFLLENLEIGLVSCQESNYLCRERRFFIVLK